MSPRHPMPRDTAKGTPSSQGATQEAGHTTCSRAPLRERRKEQTREEIADAAFGLFERHGVDATTIEDIAEAAGVSARTFFRYFTSKEAAVLEVLCDFHRALDEALKENAGKKASPLAVLRRGYGRVLATYGDGTSRSAQRLLRLRRLLPDNPTLRAVLLEHEARTREQLCREFARREGVELDVDFRVRLEVELAGAACRVALDTWAGRIAAGKSADCLTIYEQIFEAMKRGRLR